MTTVTHRHSRPHHNDEPNAFGSDSESRRSAAEVIAAATSAEYVADHPLMELLAFDRADGYRLR